MSPMRFRFVFSDLTPTNSLVMVMEPTGLKEDCQLYRVSKSPFSSAPLRGARPSYIAEFYYR